MIIFDFDHTLFDTLLLKDDLRKVFVRYGLTNEKFWETIKKSYHIDPKTDGDYSIEKHLSILNDFDEDTKDEIKQELEDVIMRTGKDYLYGDVVSVLKKLKEDGQRVVLVSRGVKVFQELKLEATDIKKYFDKIYITPDDKVKIVGEIINSEEKVYDINDHAGETKKLLKSFPNINCILIHRPGYDMPDTELPVLNDLNDIFKYTSTLK